jgi:hypothetical protein
VTHARQLANGFFADAAVRASDEYDFHAATMDSPRQIDQQKVESLR